MLRNTDCFKLLWIFEPGFMITSYSWKFYLHLSEMNCFPWTKFLGDRWIYLHSLATILQIEDKIYKLEILYCIEIPLHMEAFSEVKNLLPLWAEYFFNKEDTCVNGLHLCFYIHLLSTNVTWGGIAGSKYHSGIVVREKEAKCSRSKWLFFSLLSFD